MTHRADSVDTDAHFEIAGTRIGAGQPPYIIAEVSGNHAGSLDTALKMIDAAAAAGVSAVKLQTYTADMMTIDHAGPGFVLTSGLWRGRTFYDLYQQAHTPTQWHKPLFDHARACGVTIFSSPFGQQAIDLLEQLDTPAYKIASFEITDVHLLRQVRQTGKPVIVSTGMATLGEIEQALEILAGVPVAVMYCTSSYPAPLADANLATLAHLRQMLRVPVGLSDHTLGIAAPVAACAMGASLIEKHFCLRGVEAVDSAFSIDEQDLAQMVIMCRQAQEAVGHVRYGVKPSDQESRQHRRSIYVTRDMTAGEILTRDHVRVIRPGYGLPPAELEHVLGLPVARDMQRGHPLSWDDLAQPL